MCSSEYFGRRKNGTMSSLSSSLLYKMNYSLFTRLVLLLLLVNNEVVMMTTMGASVTGSEQSTSSSSSPIIITSSSTTQSSVDHHQEGASPSHQSTEIYHSSTESFVTKIGNGFERLVVSIDDSLALLSQQSATSSSSSLPSTTAPTSSKGSPYQPQPQHECQTVLEQLKMVWIESPTNPTLKVIDIAAVAEVAHNYSKDIIVVVDNTFLTSYYQELLSRTSDYLYKATKGQTYFRQMSLLLPPSWANVNCTGTYQGSSRFLFPAEELLTAQAVSPSATYHAQTTADIYVTSDHPVYIDRPWTLQYGGCGVPGKKISIPVSFLTTGVLGPQGDLKARLLVREWVKYRYGVFDESGFALDDKYPLEYIGNEGKPVSSACHLNLTNCRDPENCDIALSLDDGESSGMTSGTTLSSYSTTSSGPSSGYSTEASSSSTAVSPRPRDILSLMSLPLDSKVNEFCDEHTHVRTTPTKHNFLCNGKSVWEVMRQHRDFKNVHGSHNTNKGSTTATRSIISAPPPSFSFVTAKTSRIIFLLDRTQSMTQNNRWSNLRRSLYRMFHHVPAGVELGVISFTNVSAVSLPLTVAGTSNRDHLHGRVPLRPLTTLPEDACISCALKTAIKLLKSTGDSYNSNPATIVLISGSSKLSTKEWEKTSRIMESNNPIRTLVISYDDSIKSGHFSELTKYGELIRVSDSDLHSKSKNLEQSLNLNNIFLKVINEQVGAQLHKVHETVQWPNSDWQVRGKFTVEDSLGRGTVVTVTPEELGDVDGFQLTSPSGKEFDLPLNAEGMTFLRIPGEAEAGLWTYTVRFYHNQQPRPISIDVVTEARKPEAIFVRFWNNVLKQTVRNGGTEVVLLYAQVLQGDLPVLNANVTVTIRLPSGGQHHQSHNTPMSLIRVPLLDTGSGDPDITWGDGIYSAYFTQLGPLPGVFGASLQVNDNNGQAVVPVHTNITRGSYDKAPCCGSSVPHIATIPTGTFNRHMIGASFTVKHSIPLGEDPYPPGRVTDLRVERVVDSASEIKLSWTAPGGDFDKGKAVKYEIRCYTSRDALTNEHFMTQGILVHSSLTPEPESYGVRQSCVVAVPWENDYFYYGIVAIDSALNRGKVSNLVSVFIRETPTSTVKLTDAWEDDALVSNLTSSRSLNLYNQNNPKYPGVFNAGASWFRGLNETELYVVLAGAAAFLILVSTLILALACVRRNRKKSNECPPAYHNIYTDGTGATVKSPSGAYPPNKKPSEDMIVMGCCWENESPNSSRKESPLTNSSNKMSASTNSIACNAGKMSSYIPASALYPPVTQNGNNNAGSQYRDIYSGGNSNTDNSSVGSKPSDGGSSEATTHLTHDSFNNAHLLPSGGHISPAYYPMGLTTSMSFDPLNSSTQVYNSPARHNNVFNGKSPSASDDDDGGFGLNNKSNQQQLQHSSHLPSSMTRLHDAGGHYMDSGNLSRVSMPMPSSGTTITTSECDKVGSPYPNGSYGGSIMSIPNNNIHGGSQKKRTRHISFV